MSITQSVSWSYRALSLSGCLLCVGLLGAALFFQYVQHLDPCPLCILQRVAFMFLGLILLLAGIHNPIQKGRLVYSLLATVAALLGAFVAARHVWLQNLPVDKVPDCGPGFDYIVDVFPVIEGLRMILSGSGECAEVSWRFVGLTMPAWTLIVFVLATGICIWVATHYRQLK